MGAHSTQMRRLSLRIRAILAGAIVIGVGATATLASWTDSEFETATFSSSVFNTESSVQGGAYADNNVAPGPSVTFAGSGFSPGTIGYIQVLVRTKATSSAGTVSLSGATLGGADTATLGAAFVYRVVRTTATCNATAFTGSPTFVVGGAATYRALTLAQEVGVTNNLGAATAVAPGAATGFCFEVTLPAGAPNTLQGKTATATWQLTATSS